MNAYFLIVNIFICICLPQLEKSVYIIDFQIKIRTLSIEKIK